MDVILIPGLWLDADSWGQATPALEALNNRVTVVPLPGLGVPAPDSSQLGMQDWVDAIVAVIDGADRPVVLVGHSGGGNAAWGAASARPDRVARVVFVDTVPPPPGGIVSEFEVSDGVVPFPGWDWFPDEDVHDLDAATRERTAPMTRSVPARIPTDEIVLASDARFDIPVTLMMGAFDSPTFRETVREWGPYATEFEAIRDSTVVKLDSAHWPQFSQPLAFTKQLLAAVAG